MNTATTIVSWYNFSNVRLRNREKTEINSLRGTLILVLLSLSLILSKKESLNEYLYRCYFEWNSASATRTAAALEARVNYWAAWENHGIYLIDFNFPIFPWSENEWWSLHQTSNDSISVTFDSKAGVSGATIQAGSDTFPIEYLLE